ncbi:MAG: phosphoribosylglycinamide formyltransferase [Geminicoccaceae bacterium]
MPEARRRAAVLISGRGSNLEALIDACRHPAASAEIALVVSDHADAAGLEHARRAGIATEVITDAKRDNFEQRLNTALERFDVQWVCLAGFMRILSRSQVERWRDRLLNVHPSLLPAFRGLDTHRRALEAGVRFHGCTVHLVRAEIDAGPIIVQGVVPVLPEDDEKGLAARVLALEHRCYPLALELVASGRARVVDQRVVIEGAATAEASLLNPPSLGGT